MKFVFGKQDTTTLDQAQERCCLLTNGPGGYLSVSAAFSVTRCDQGVLAAARTASNDRWTLVHRLSEALTVGEEQVFLSTQTFADDAPPPAVRSGGPSVRGRRGGPWRSSSPWRAGRPGPQPLSRGRGGAPLQHRGRGPSAAPLRVDILRQDRGRRFRPQGLAGHGAHYRRLPPGDPPRHPHGAGRPHLRGGGAGPGDMDGRLRGGPSAPRHGKPVEINAHWYNALRMMEELSALTAADGREYYGPGRAGLGELQPGVLDGG